MCRLKPYFYKQHKNFVRRAFFCFLKQNFERKRLPACNKKISRVHQRNKKTLGLRFFFATCKALPVNSYAKAYLVAELYKQPIQFINHANFPFFCKYTKTGFTFLSRTIFVVTPNTNLCSKLFLFNMRMRHLFRQLLPKYYAHLNFVESSASTNQKKIFLQWQFTYLRL